MSQILIRCPDTGNSCRCEIPYSECVKAAKSAGRLSKRHPEDVREKIADPKSKMDALVRRLAEAAMSITHHDASDEEPGYIHEVQSMERRFTAILRGKLRA